MSTDVVLRNREGGVTAAFILTLATDPRTINIDDIEWDDVKLDTQFRFVKVMQGLGRDVNDDNIAALMDQEQALLQQCWDWSKARAYEKQGVRRRRVVSDEITLMIADGDEAISHEVWDSRAMDEIDDDWSGRYKEVRDNATPVVLKALDIAKQALAYVEDDLPIPSRLRKAAHTIRKQNPTLLMDLRLLAA